MSKNSQQKPALRSIFAKPVKVGADKSVPGHLPAEKTAVGNIDMVADGLIEGWVKDLADNAALTVDVFLDNTPLAREIVADRYRKDVEQAGYGSGRHGFSCPVPEGMSPLGGRLELRPAGASTVLLSEVITAAMMAERPRPATQTDPAVGEALAPNDAGPDRTAAPAKTMSPSATQVQGESATGTQGKMYCAPGFTGSIDRIRNNVLKGWVRGPNDAETLILDVFADNVLLAEAIPADKYRRDVEGAGFGTGWYGFAYDLPAGISLAGQRLDIRLAGDDTVVLSKTVPPEMPARAAGAVIGSDSSSGNVSGKADGPAAYECRIDVLSETLIRGWAVNTNHPGNVFTIDLFVDGVLLAQVSNDKRRSDLEKLGKSEGVGGFEHRLLLGYLETGKHIVTIGLPDGNRIQKEIEIKENTLRYPLNAGVAKILPSQTAIIVPIYDAAEDVMTCIERLLEHTPKDIDIVLIDDASSDPRIEVLLAEAQKHPRFRTLRNATNLGFTRTVNRGLAEIGRKHAILLNSDARVTPGWVHGLLRAASSRPMVATVTAMSDRAGAFSAPTIGNDNPLPAGVAEDVYARAFRQRSLGLYPLVPTGNGFCMFVNRTCIDDIGPFDDKAFPRGYGEENDFCMRAGRAGWSNLIDDCTYVFHDRSKSFGSAKTELMDAGRRVIDDRYPEYKAAIRVFSTGAEISLARFRAAQALQDCSSPSAALPAILYVVSTQTGGTPQTNMDLMQQIADEMQPWLLQCNSRRLTLQRLEGGQLVDVKTHDLVEPVDPVTHRSGEYDAVVANWLDLVDPRMVHIRHLAWHSLSLPRLAKARSCPVVFSFHDFYAICPTVKLLDEQNVYCGGNCTKTEGDCKVELWAADSMPKLKNAWVHVWRERFNEVLQDCDIFVTTSESARTQILAHFDLDEDRFFVIPHGRNFADMLQLRSRRRQGEPIRILVPGNINAAKGRDIITALARHDRAGLLQFHILGNMKDAAAWEISPNIVLHGTYPRDDFAKRVATIRPHLGAIFSIWNETYCHTLTELWSVGLPAVVFDFPTVATRVRDTGAGWVVPHDDIAVLYDQLVRLGSDVEEQTRAEAAVHKWQEGYGVGRTTRVMAAAYREVYRNASGQSSSRPLIAVVSPAQPNLLHANASTEIRVWERTINRSDRSCVFVRMAPDTVLANIREGTVDGVIVQRNALPPTMVTPFLNTVAEAGISYLLDLDDDLFDVPADKDPFGRYAAYSPLLEQVTRSAAVVTTTTEPLRHKLTALNPATILVPNRLSERLWRGPLPKREPDGLVRALYMGTVTHQADFELIAPALKAMLAEDPNFRVAIIGIQTDDLPHWAERIDIPGAAKSYSNFVPWLRHQSTRFDFALAPLLDTPFNRSKSNLKALDCGALGLPVLASDMRVYRDLHGQMPWLELVGDHPSAWHKAIRRAIAAAREGQVDRAAIRDWVFSEHGLMASLADYDALLQSLARPGDLDRLAARGPAIAGRNGQKAARS
ncbi:glycosyltransferase [Pseudoroseicyclus sp. H15]